MNSASREDIIRGLRDLLPVGSHLFVELDKYHDSGAADFRVYMVTSQSHRILNITRNVAKATKFELSRAGYLRVKGAGFSKEDTIAETLGAVLWGDMTAIKAERL